MEVAYEVERKRQIPHGQFELLEKLLTEHGYSLESTTYENDTYYSRPDVDYMKTVECLRVRSKPGFSEITYKPPTTTQTSSHDSIIIKQEINLVLKDEASATQATMLMQAVGMIKLVTVKKKRKIYAHPERSDATVMLDTLEGVGDFIEVEVVSSDQSGALSTMKAIEVALGLDAFAIVSQPYRDLAMTALEG